jgi:antitoxin component of MazEF toxin-antitoxin module
MLTTLRKIGNSKGIIIPAALLSACDFTDRTRLPLGAVSRSVFWRRAER